MQSAERHYTTDQEAYEVFVGSITPKEFVSDYQDFECPVDEAIKDFIRQWPYPDENVPSWLEDALYRYVESSI